MQSYYVGLDVHSRESVFVVENDAGAIVARGSVPTTINGLKHLRDSCGLPAATDVALETGTSAFFVARELNREIEDVLHYARLLIVGLFHEEGVILDAFGERFSGEERNE